jgi:uncharacterized protein YggE
MNNKAVYIFSIFLLFAIIVSGALIAGAIYFSNQANTNEGKGDKTTVSSDILVSSSANTLTVTATSYEDVIPDLARLTVNNNSQFEATARDAIGNIKNSIDEVIDLLLKAGVAVSDLQTSGISSYYESYSGYYSSNGGISIIVRDVDSLAMLLDTLGGVSNYSSCWYSFEKQDSKEAYEVAMQHAIAEAKHKAEIMAEGMGFTLGKIIAVDDSPNYSVNPLRNYDTIGKGDGVMTGTTQIQATVSITFEIQ